MAEAVLPTLDQPVVSFEKRRPVFPFANMRITLNSAVLLDWHDVNLQTVQERVFMRGCSSKHSFPPHWWDLKSKAPRDSRVSESSREKKGNTIGLF